MAKIDYTVGTQGVKKRDFLLYMRERAAYTAAQAALSAEFIEGENVEDSVAALSAAGYAAWIATPASPDDQIFTEIGEMIKDSIGHEITANETIELNKSGEKQIDKQGTINWTDANITYSNLAALEGLDGKSVDILVASDEGDFAMLYPSIIYNHNESINSGGVQQLPISLNKKITTVGAFRKLIDVANLS